ncbi:hypothetical protein KAW96_04895 [candidate division WOR-3 bacterium]|nr:hypothetical protein [candidate division WOR-3 bacterium]
MDEFGVPEQLAVAIEDIKKAIDCCFEENSLIPGLIIVYATIDIMGWLNMPESQKDSSGDDFRNWARKFLIQELPLECNADDLWGARCGILHSYSAESSQSRGSLARKVHYASKRLHAKELQELYEEINKDDSVVIAIEELYEAIKNSIVNFLEFLEANPEHAEIVFQRAKKIFGKFPV